MILKSRRYITFCGPKSSGKDTAGNYLAARSSLIRPDLFVQLNYADNVRKVCEIVFGFSMAEMTDQALKELVVDRWPNISPREGQISVAKTFRTLFGGDIWCKAWDRDMRKIHASCVYNTDMRHPEELEQQEALNALKIYIQNDRVEQEMLEAQAKGDPLWSDISESFYGLLKSRADVIITNNGSIPELHSQVAQVVEDRWGDWTSWFDTPSSVTQHTQQPSI